MIKTLWFCLLLTAFSTAELNQRTIAGTNDISFEISNQQPLGVGTVTVSTADQDYYVPVPNETDYYVLIPEQAVSVTIAGTVIGNGNQALVALPSGDTVGVKWPSNGAVVIVDRDEIF